MGKVSRLWVRFWVRLSGPSGFGRFAARLAVLFAPPFKARRYLAGFHPQGFVSPTAKIYGVTLKRGAHVLVGDGVICYGYGDDVIELGDRVVINDETTIEAGLGGSLHVGAHTTIQPRCQFACYGSPIRIGSNVQIAPYCCFYPYDHGLAPNKRPTEQPITTKGGIVIEDDVTFGVGVTVLDGVRIGQGAVIGANSLVMHDVPANAIAIGVPAKVVRMRDELLPYEEEAAAKSN